MPSLTSVNLRSMSRDNHTHLWIRALKVLVACCPTRSDNQVTPICMLHCCGFVSCGLGAARRNLALIAGPGGPMGRFNMPAHVSECARALLMKPRSHQMASFGRLRFILMWLPCVASSFRSQRACRTPCCTPLTGADPHARTVDDISLLCHHHQVRL